MSAFDADGGRLDIGIDDTPARRLSSDMAWQRALERHLQQFARAEAAKPGNIVIIGGVARD